MSNVSKMVGGAVGASVGSSTGGVVGAGLAALGLPADAHVGWFVLTIVLCQAMTTIGTVVRAVYAAPANAPEA